MFGDLGKIMKLARDMKEKMPAMQEKLARTEFTAEAGGGAVAATVNGKLGLVRVKLSADVVKEGDVEMLEDLICSAVTAAQKQAAEAGAELMASLTGGIKMPPGMEGILG